MHKGVSVPVPDVKGLSAGGREASEGNGLAAKVAAPIGCFVLVAAIFWFVLAKRRRQQQEEERQKQTGAGHEQVQPEVAI